MGQQPWRWVGPVPLGNLHKGILGVKGEEGGGVSGRGDTQQALGKLHPRPGCDPALSPDADLNVLSHPSILLVVLLNVSLNTLPVLALHVIYQALKKPHSKVRVAGVPTVHSWDPSTGAGAGSRDSKEMQSWG